MRVTTQVGAYRMQDFYAPAVAAMKHLRTARRAFHIVHPAGNPGRIQGKSQANNMSPSHFDLVSHWRIAAPVEHVWATLADPESWPQWWPYVRSVRTIRQGDADGLGSVRRIEWATRLPYDIVIEVEAIESLRLERLRARSHGQLRGEGIWLLRSEGRFTDVTYVWRVELAKRWMRWLAPVLAPVFRWNHAGVMRAGGIGLACHLRRVAALEMH